MHPPIPVVDHPVFFLDYDGTLAPIVADPARAYPHPAVPPLLVELSSTCPLWIVTGRNLGDLEAFLHHPYPAVGLHGMQRGVIGGAVDSLLSDEERMAIDRLRARIPDADGLVEEDKGPTFAVHYRRADDAQAAQRALEEWLAGLPDVLEAIWGKKVVEVRPRGIDKGVAVLSILEDYGDRTPVYLGDDVTDEDAFAALDPPAITIKVGKGTTHARYRLPDVDAVVDYLRRYVS